MQAYSWEPSLLSLAHEAVNSVVPTRDGVSFEEKALTTAYAHAASITATHSRSFHLASSLLPPDKRRSARALYAFCRHLDDRVDENTHQDSSRIESELFGLAPSKSVGPPPG